MGRGMAAYAVALLLLASVPGNNAHAQTLNTLYNFTGGSDGSGPNDGMVFDAVGNLYSTTLAGGISTDKGGNGVVFELSPAGGGVWTETVLYEFAGGTADGYWPFYGVVFDKNGNLFGTTAYGGASGQGTVFELSPKSGGGWTETVLYNFTGGSDGALPMTGVILDAAGNLYGVTVTGGAAQRGTAFQLSPAGGVWTFTLIQTFSHTPSGPLVIDPSGRLFGTTQNGGTAGQGSVYRLTNSPGGWKFRTLYSFLGGSDGSDPQTGVTLVPNGHLVGVTGGGGSKSTGTAFELVPGAGGVWTENQLYSFGTRKADPIYPSRPLTVGLSKGLWGASVSGGNAGSGGVFSLTHSSSGWQERNVFESGIAGPVAISAVDSSGSLFGPGFGGTYGAGSVVQLVP